MVSGSDVSSVCLSRCLCIHSQLQLVDLTISAVLLHHGILPAPLAAVPQPPPHTLHKTLQGIQAVQRELQAAFRSRHRRAISEVLMSVGPSPFRPLQLYRVPISICDGEDSEHDRCGSPCSDLSPAEMRKVNLHLFRSLPPEDARSSGMRMFVYLKGSDALVSENIEESDVSLHPEKCRWMSFLHRECPHRVSDDVREGDGLQWLRVAPFIVQGKL